MGAKIKFENLLLSYKKELFIFLAGALFNLMLCVFLLFSIRLDPTAEKIYFLFSNFFFAVFNLMPLPGLDGSQALFSFLCLFCEEERAYRISFAAQTASLVLLAGAAIFLFLRYKNDSLILMTFFLFLEFREKNKATKHS